MIHTRATIIKATITAVLMASLILVTVVLPAEYGIDPLGTGEYFGLAGLSGTASPAVTEQTGPLSNDKITFVLGSYESVEYKYETERGASLVYDWRATAPVTYDFHGEPVEGPAGFAESYTAGKAALGQGSFEAPFTGIHGWFFENRSFADVTVTLRTSGFYRRSFTYRDGFVDTREFGDP
ncbi:MAG: hypothetical protein WD558_05880 [Pseudomonadales bacterium]